VSQAEERSRRELAHFLRSRRERVDPGDVGLPVGPRRRTLGLRREEVAVLAGLSPTWYTYLEQGRNIRPSPEVLDSLARVLRLSEDERAYIHFLAHGEVTSPSRQLSPTARSFVEQLVRITGTGPYPVYALDYAGDVVAWNDAAVEWYTDWGKRSGVDRNIVWWIVTDPEAQERIGDWEDDARDIVCRCRAAWARHNSDQRIQDLIRRLRAASPEFWQWWTDHDVRGQRHRTRLFRHERLGMRTMQIAVMHPDDYSSVTIAFHLPASDDDEL
jgi:transcriptional regulator with XRE-family HTH domain